MKKLPRDMSHSELIQRLKFYEFKIVRQTGSHIRLKSSYTGIEFQITIPAHDPIRIGTLNSILNTIAQYLKIDKSELLDKLFK